MPTASLPYIDEHHTEIAASTDAVWHALGGMLEQSFTGRGTDQYLRAVGCIDVEPSGPRPLAEGSSVRGFHVVRAVPGSELALEGRHRFSTYALTFRIDAIGERRSRLRADTHATFPGAGGAIYRLLVVGTGGHKIAVRRMLHAVRRGAEPAAR